MFKLLKHSVASSTQNICFLIITMYLILLTGALGLLCNQSVSVCVWCLQTKAYFLLLPVVKEKPSQLSSVLAMAELTLSTLARCLKSSPESSECRTLAALWQRCTYFLKLTADWAVSKVYRIACKAPGRICINTCRFEWVVVEVIHTVTGVTLVPAGCCERFRTANVYRLTWEEVTF